MSMYGKYPKVKNAKGEWVEQNGLNGAPKAWPRTYCGPNKSVQAQANETNINKIMKKIERGQMINTNAEEGRFEDISDFDGLADATIKVLRAKDLFMGLSADVRARFHNNPTELFEFLDEESNRPEAVELGLVKAPPPPPPIPAEAK